MRFSTSETLTHTAYPITMASGIFHIIGAPVIDIIVSGRIFCKKKKHNHQPPQGLHHLAAHASSPDPWQYAAQATATSSYHRSVQVSFVLNDHDVHGEGE